MEFIQKKSLDTSVEHFLPRAAEEGHALIWDRFEAQLPECGFCEAGLSCRDCLQGPCIAHPFKDADKKGVCGKDKDILAAQTLLRLAVKGTLAALDQVSDLARVVTTGQMKPKRKGRADQAAADLARLLTDGNAKLLKLFPKAMVEAWRAAGVCPEGLGRDLFKAAQKVEGGMTGVGETLLWAVKAALLGSMAQRLQGELKRAVFGDVKPTALSVGLGLLAGDVPTILLAGRVSPVLKQQVALEADKKRVRVLGLCTDPLIPPFSFAPVTNYGSQEIALLTGAVDVLVAADQFVNPSLARLAKDWQVQVVETEGLMPEKSLEALARGIVEKAGRAHDLRRRIPRDVPEAMAPAVMGFSAESLDGAKIAKALRAGKIKGVVLLGGSNNVKLPQDNEMLAMATELLKGDVLCLSTGEASVGLGKYGLLNPAERSRHCGAALEAVLGSLGKGVPAVLDLGSGENGGGAAFLAALSEAARKPLKALPVMAVFCEANRSGEVADALAAVAMGVSTYFWPGLPVVGSPEVVAALSGFLAETFGAGLHVSTDRKTDALTKARTVMRALAGYAGPGMSGKSWE